MAEGKMPDAAEWAERVHNVSRNLGERWRSKRLASITRELADLQRETLLWAAEYTRQQGLCYIAEKLERLAEGRVEDKHE